MNVYCLYFPNGKRYVGTESTHGKRIRQHSKMQSLNKPNQKDRQVVHYAIKKYGWENVKWRYLATNCSNQDGWGLEVFFISTMDLQNPECGYNKSSGGEFSGLGVKHSKERIERRKNTLAQKGKHGGEQLLTPESRAKAIESRRNGAGWAKTDGMRENSRKAQLKIPRSPASIKTQFKPGHGKGRIVSTETREKLSASGMGHKISPETRLKIVATRRLHANMVPLPSGKNGEIIWYRPEQLI